MYSWTKAYKHVRKEKPVSFKWMRPNWDWKVTCSIVEPTRSVVEESNWLDEAERSCSFCKAFPVKETQRLIYGSCLRRFMQMDPVYLHGVASLHECFFVTFRPHCFSFSELRVAYVGLFPPHLDPQAKGDAPRSSREFPDRKSTTTRIPHITIRTGL